MQTSFIEQLKEFTRQNSQVKDIAASIKNDIMIAAKSGKFCVSVPCPIQRTEVQHYLQSEGFHVSIYETCEGETRMNIAWYV